MKLIPVLDLKGGTTVAARLGNRAAYAPLVSPLCDSSDPHAITAALLKRHPFDTLYIADLDAICGEGSHLHLIESLHRAYPQVELWVDSGLRDLDQIRRFARPVIGTESLETFSQLAQIMHALRAPILSLDFREDWPVGLEEAAGATTLWPQDVIAMSLSRVGSRAGPDLALLERLRRASPDVRLYAAGGVRDHTDLGELEAIGLAGALVSTALHRDPDGLAAPDPSPR